MKKLKLLVYGGTFAYNRGDAGRAKVFFGEIRKYLELSKIELITPNYDIDQKYAKQFQLKIIKVPYSDPVNYIKRNVSIILWVLFKKFFNRDFKFLRKDKILDIFFKNDLILDLDGDTFSNVYGKRAILDKALKILWAKWFNKKSIIFAQSIGPLGTGIINKLGVYALNNTTLILVRDKITYNYLLKEGVSKNNLKLTNDLHFLLAAKKSNKVRKIIWKNNLKENGFIAINLSQHLYHLMGEKYIDIFLKIIKELVTNYNEKIVLIPNCYGKKHTVDDLSICKKVYSLIDNKNVFLLEEELEPEELKEFIGQSKLLIASRMHALIAGLGMNVPCIGISYSPKYKGILKHFKLEDRVINLKELSSEQILKKYNKKIVIKKNKIKVMQNMAKLNFKYLQERLKK